MGKAEEEENSWQVEQYMQMPCDRKDHGTFEELKEAWGVGSRGNVAGEVGLNHVRAL